MTDETAEFVGTVDDLDQDEARETYRIENVPVNVDGPVQVHMVPSVGAGSRSYNTVGTSAQRVGNVNPRRRSITLLSIGENIIVGFSQNECDSGYGALWAENVPLVMTHRDQVYVKSFTATTVVSVIEENWAS